MRSLNIQLPDPVYSAIAQAAAASGLSVEAIVAKQLAVDFGDEVPTGFFSPALLAEIDAAREESRLGGSLSLDEVTERRLAKSKAWRENRPA